MQGSRLVTPYLTPAVASGTQLNQQPEGLAGPDDEQVRNSDSDPDNMNEGSSPVVNMSEEMLEPRRSEDGGLADLIREQLEEEDIEDQGTRERLVERVVRLVSARLGAHTEEVPPSYASQS